MSIAMRVSGNYQVTDETFLIIRNNYRDITDITRGGNPQTTPNFRPLFSSHEIFSRVSEAKNRFFKVRGDLSHNFTLFIDELYAKENPDIIPNPLLDRLAYQERFISNCLGRVYKPSVFMLNVGFTYVALLVEAENKPFLLKTYLIAQDHGIYHKHANPQVEEDTQHLEHSQDRVGTVCENCAIL